MANIEYRILAPVAKYQGKDGRNRRVSRPIGEIFVHSDGRRYIALDPFFNFAACERAPGRDKLFLSCEPVEPQQ